MYKILITGSNGFIGSHLITELKKINHVIIEFKGKVEDNKDWENIFNVDILIHLAAKTYVPDSWENPSIFLKNNIDGTINALEFCKKNNVKLIFLSSYLYGSTNYLPINEKEILKATNPYALSKKLCEELVCFYNEKFGLKSLIFRPFNVYGNGQNLNFLIPEILNQIKYKEEIILKDLEPKRDYIHVNDLVYAIIKSINCELNFGIFNIGSGFSFSVLEIANIIQSILKTNKPIINLKIRRKDEIMDSIADIAFAKEKLNWQPKISIYEGLSDIISNYN